VTRDSYPAAIARLVLGPLGMTHSNYVQQPDAIARAQLALGHDDDGEPHSVGFRIHPELAAAGLWTTPGDLARVLLAIMRAWHGAAGAFLPQALAQAMLTPVAQYAGLGVFRDGGLFTHVGANIGYRALFVADAAAERAMVVMTNGDNGDPVCLEI